MLRSERGRRSSRIVAILAMLWLVAVTAWFIVGCSQKSSDTTTKTTETKDDGDVHVKVDLPDTVTIKP